MPHATGILHIDGGSRGNPGPAGYGFVILRDGRPPVRGNGRLGHATNNVAEYSGLVNGLAKAHELGLADLLVRSDSELLVKQMNGQYRVKNEQLQELFAQAKKLARKIGSVRYVHVYREQNSEADGLANLAMDGQLVDEIEATETQPEMPAPPRLSLKEALRQKKEDDGAAPKADPWHALRSTFLYQLRDEALADRLVEVVKAQGFKPKR